MTSMWPAVNKAIRRGGATSMQKHFLKKCREREHALILAMKNAKIQKLNQILIYLLP